MEFKDWAGSCAEHFEKTAYYALPLEQWQPWKLHEAMRYAVLDGGKRIRPLMVYAAGQLVRAEPEAMDHFALAVEYLHSYSLVHDDMPCMDNDSLRRGKPTTHRKFGEAMGMLAGDALQAQAFAEVVKAKVPAEHAVAAVRLLASGAGSLGMCGGQGIDLLSVHSQLDLSMLTTMHRMKTGALIRTSALMGLYAGQEKPQAQLLSLVTTWAEAVGLAFQVIDDILDVTADTATLGKTAGKDAANDKPTFVSLLGIDKARALAAEQAQTARQALQEIEALPGLEGKSLRLQQITDYIISRDH